MSQLAVGRLCWTVLLLTVGCEVLMIVSFLQGDIVAGCVALLGYMAGFPWVLGLLIRWREEIAARWPN